MEESNHPTAEDRFSVEPTVMLHVRRWSPPGATGVPVLLVHGLGDNARQWDGVAATLSAGGHPVVALDQRGHGRSDKPGHGYDFATLTSDLRMVLGQLGWLGGARIPFVAGHGWGANVVLELAVRHRDTLRGLALVDGGTIELSGRFADWPTCQAAMAPPDLGTITAGRHARMLRTRYPDWPDSGITGLLANLDVQADGTVRPWLAPSHHLAALTHLWNHHPPARYPLVTVPLLLVTSVDLDAPDARFDAALRHEIDRARQALPHAMVVSLPCDDHLPAARPDQVAALIHAATEDRPGTPSPAR